MGQNKMLHVGIFACFMGATLLAADCSVPEMDHKHCLSCHRKLKPCLTQWIPNREAVEAVEVAVAEVEASGAAEVEASAEEEEAATGAEEVIAEAGVMSAAVIVVAAVTSGAEPTVVEATSAVAPTVAALTAEERASGESADIMDTTPTACTIRSAAEPLTTMTTSAVAIVYFPAGTGFRIIPAIIITTTVTTSMITATTDFTLARATQIMTPLTPERLPTMRTTRPRTIRLSTTARTITATARPVVLLLPVEQEL